MAGQLLPWIDSGDAEGNRNSMQNFLLDGIEDSFDFNFAGGYIDASHVKAYIYHTVSGITEAIDPVVLTGPNTIQIDPTGLAGDYLVVYRDTPKDQPLIDYSTGAVLDELNLDTANKQAVFATAEMSDRFDAINASSADAIERSFTALTIANAADDKADIAIADSAAAVVTADAAEVTAANALQVAEDAVAAATGFQTNLEFYTGDDVTSRGADWQTGTVASPGNQRWFAGTDTASDFTIDRYNDAGVLQGSAVKVDRQTGNVTLESQLDMTSSKIVNVVDGTAAQDAATRGQVDLVQAASAQRAANLSDLADTNAARNTLGASGYRRVMRLVGANNVGVPLSRLDLSAEAVVLCNSAGAAVVRTGVPTTTNDVALAGPAANGRDQAGAFTPGSWVHFYWIWNGTTLSTLSSLSSSAPVLPSGYTHWAYATSVRYSATGELLAVLIRGSEVAYNMSPTVNRIMLDGRATVFTAIANLETVVPPNATHLHGHFTLSGNHSSAPGTAVSDIRPGGTALLFSTNTTAWATTGFSYQTRNSMYVPWTGSLEYRIAATLPATGGLTLDVLGYRLVNGDS